MNLRKKGALELSMNTIVIVVIGITLLVLGLGFVTGIFGNLNTLSQDVFEDAQNSINAISTHNQRLTVPSEINVKQGDSASSKIWVMNEGSQRQTFSLDITSAPDNNFDKKGIDLFIPQKQATVETGGEVGFAIGITVSKTVPRGLHGYNVKINDNYAQDSFFVKVE